MAASFGALGPLYDGVIEFHLKARGAPAIAAADPIAIVVLVVLAYLGIAAVLGIGLARLPRDEALACCVRGRTRGAGWPAAYCSARSSARCCTTTSSSSRGRLP